MSPVLKPWGTSQDGFRPWGVRTKPRLFGHGLSHRSVPATSKPGHAAQGLQVGASLGSPGKPPLRRVHRLRGANGGGIIQVYAPTSNAEAAEVEQFYEDLQDLLELTPKKKKMSFSL